MTMKNIILAFSMLSLLFITQSCDEDLPYPIDEVKRGVVIDIVRVEGSDGVLSDGLTTGNYQVKLSIPEQQGDYSFMSHVQLLAVLQSSDGVLSSEVIADDINGFPQEIQIDIADTYSKFELTTPSLGEILYFTANVVLKDGTVIPGWSKEIGFNNKALAGWQTEDRAYSYNVRYAVACPLVLDDFIGTCTVTLDEWWGDTPYDVTVTKISDTELSISGMCDGYCSNDLVIKVDPTDHSISIAKQVLEPNSGDWWGDRPTYNNFSLEGGGTINSCETSISFTANATVDAGSFGSKSFILGK